MYSTMSDDKMMVFLLALIGVMIIVAVVTLIYQLVHQRKIRASVMKSEPISAQQFLANWKVGKRNAWGGYRAMDQPGCYVILTNPRDGVNGSVSYDAVYVGQSIHVCSRVRQHLTGHGNGDVYADIRYGQNVQVRIVPCSQHNLNAVEKDLIAAFGATKSYNKTRGGARRR